jgi:peroxiredoxin Q/BCP
MKPGDKAPEFELNDQDGNRVSLRGLLANGPVVLYFYPKDDTSGCTKEACAFRDEFAQFRNVSAQVVGVSSDSEASHRAFRAKYNLPFTLLSDPGGKLRKLYGVKSTFGIIAGRETFVIDASGIIRAIFSSQFQPGEHIRRALAALNPAAVNQRP